QLLRQDGNQGNGIVGRQKLHGFLALFPFQKAGGHQLLQNPGAGGGVPSPLRSASSGISSFPAVSIAESRVSSVKCLGGVVLPSLTAAPATGSAWPSVSSGRALSSELPSGSTFFMLAR